MLAKSPLVFVSYKEVVRYIPSLNRKYDLVFYLLFLTQTFLLSSLPSGFHSPDFKGWLGFFISMLFYLLFYPLFYFKFYNPDSSVFIREMVVLSVVARFNSFLFVGMIVLLQIFIWVLLKLPPMPNTSFFYYLLYYLMFTAFMIMMKKGALKFTLKS